MELKIEYVPITDIKPYERNAKLHPEEQIEQIQKSIQNFQMIDPIGIWHDEVVEGHGRLEACKRLGYTNVPVVRLDHLTDEQRKAYALAHNKLTMNSGFDVSLLAAELDDLAGEFDMSEYGFDLGELADEIDKYSYGDAGSLSEADDFDSEPPAEPKAKRGDIYRLGQHRCMCGDSTSAEDVAMLMDGAKADLLLTDPPYNVALGMGGSVDEARKRHRRTDGLVIMNDKMPDEKFREFLASVFKNADEVMREGASFYIWHANNESYNFNGACRDIGWTVRQTLIWNKNAITLGRQDYQWRHEPCLYGWSKGTHRWFSDRKQPTVIDMPRPTKSEEHPTMKPVALFAYQIQNSTQRGDVVLDTFGGSGTSIIASEQLTRKCYTMELDPRYVDVIIDRWEKHTGGKRNC